MKTYAVRLASFPHGNIILAESAKGAAYQAIKAARKAGYDVPLTERRTVRRIPLLDGVADFAVMYGIGPGFLGAILRKDGAMAIDWSSGLHSEVLQATCSYRLDLLAHALRPFGLASGLLSDGDDWKAEAHRKYAAERAERLKSNPSAKEAEEPEPPTFGLALGIDATDIDGVGGCRGIIWAFVFFLTLCLGGLLLGLFLKPR